MLRLMCCSEDHIGPPPEWQYLADREGDTGILPERAALPLTGARVGRGDLAALAAVLQPAPGHAPGPRPVSTEGGQGRALPTFRRTPDGAPMRDDDWAEQMAAYSAGDGEPDWASRPRSAR
jgi:hypothetical protein